MLDHVGEAIKHRLVTPYDVSSSMTSRDVCFRSITVKSINGPRRTACFAKETHSYILFTLKLYPEVQPEVIPEVQPEIIPEKQPEVVQVDSSLLTIL